MASAIAIAYAMTSSDPQPVAYTTHAVLIAATAERSCNPQNGVSLPSTAMTIPFEMLHAANNAIRSQSGVAEIRCARCSHRTANAAAGPAAKTTADAPRNRLPPLLRFTGDVSGAAPDNLTACPPSLRPPAAPAPGRVRGRIGQCVR